MCANVNKKRINQRLFHLLFMLFNRLIAGREQKNIITPWSYDTDVLLNPFRLDV